MKWNLIIDETRVNIEQLKLQMSQKYDEVCMNVDKNSWKLTFRIYEVKNWWKPRLITDHKSRKYVLIIN